MRLSRYFLLIGVVVALGCLQVAQRNAMLLSGYGMGDRLSRIHAKTNDVAWLEAQVVGLASPTRLADVAQDRGLKLVAWSTLSRAASSSTAVPTQIAQAAPGEETSD